MKRLYEDYKFGYPTYGNKFLEVPYSIIEFWHKSCFLEDLKPSKIEIRYNEEILDTYNKYKSNSFSKCLYGGQIKCTMSDCDENFIKARNVCQNLSYGTNKTKFDGILHHKNLSGRIMTAVSIGCGSVYDIKHIKEKSEMDITFWFLSIQL